jgi:cell division protein FtsL
MATKKRKAPSKAKATRPAVKKRVASSAQDSFWKIEFNVNTFYWIIIGVMVVGIAMWTYDTNQRINKMYDTVDQNNAVDEVTPRIKPTSAQPTN